MSHPREPKDTFELAENEQPQAGVFGQLEFIDRGRDQWGQPTTYPGQEHDTWGQTVGTSAKNDPWTNNPPNETGVTSRMESETGSGSTALPAVTNSDPTSTSRTVHFGEINPAFVGDDNKTPVYRTADGKAIITHEHVVQTNQDGLNVVVTSHRQTWRETEKVIREKDLKILKIFSIISIILFFPTGIPAFYFARRTHTEYHSGIIRGELDTARKMAKRCEKLIILSVMGALLIAVLTFVVLENQANKDNGGKTSKFANTFGKRAP